MKQHHAFAQWLLSFFYKTTTKVFTRRKPSFNSSSSANLLLESKKEIKSLVCDFHGGLLRSPSPFPFFMLVAFEAGSLIRALLLLICFPIIWFLGYRKNSDLGFKVMVFVTFSGLKISDVELVARAVLPKFYLEDIHLHSYELFVSSKKKIVFSFSFPVIMVEWFVSEYFGVSQVHGIDLQVVSSGRYFTGFITKPSSMAEVQQQHADIGLVSSNNSCTDHIIVSYCKEIYVVNCKGEVLPRNKYPKPLVFHDGRLVFFPTPTAMLSFFLWLPLGIILALIRALIVLYVPYKITFMASAITGMRLRVRSLENYKDANLGSNNKGVLFVCNHRSLIDPMVLSLVVEHPLTAVTYSLSRLSEILAPVPTVRLTRDRIRDGETMKRLLAQGDLVVCPEGTTCREPYLLRFSPLFAELTDEIMPVALKTEVDVFYGTTASGFKWLDPVFLALNMSPAYWLEFLGRVPRELTCSGGGLTGADVANKIQRQLAGVLGFECTALTRKDKYLALAGNEGVVGQPLKSGQ